VHRLRAAIAVCVVAASVEASAATCTVSAVGLAFGTYDLFATAPLDVTGSVEFRCNEPTGMRIQFSPGSSGTFWPRTMRNGAASLEYNVYTSAGRTQVWGDGTGGTSDRRTGASRGQPLPIFGRIPPRQDAASGVYTDTLVATFNF